MFAKIIYQNYLTRKLQNRILTGCNQYISKSANSSLKYILNIKEPKNSRRWLNVVNGSKMYKKIKKSVTTVG